MSAPIAPNLSGQQRKRQLSPRLSSPSSSCSALAYARIIHLASRCSPLFLPYGTFAVSQGSVKGRLRTRLLTIFRYGKCDNRYTYSTLVVPNPNFQQRSPVYALSANDRLSLRLVLRCRSTAFQNANCVQILTRNSDKFECRQGRAPALSSFTISISCGASVRLQRCNNLALQL